MEGHLQSAVLHLRALRDEIDEMLAELTSISTVPAAAGSSTNDLVQPRGRLEDIFEPPVLAALVRDGQISSGEVLNLLPGKEHMGPLANAWRLRARRAGHDYETLVKKSKTGPGGTTVFTLTDKGRQLLGPIVEAAGTASERTEQPPPMR